MLSYLFPIKPMSQKQTMVVFGILLFIIGGIATGAGMAGLYNELVWLGALTGGGISCGLSGLALLLAV